jgi:hypothetical protein
MTVYRKIPKRKPMTVSPQPGEPVFLVIGKLDAARMVYMRNDHGNPDGFSGSPKTGMTVFVGKSINH